jgi:hypothetical protein
MPDLKVVLRYFPVGDVAGTARKITADKLEDIAAHCHVKIQLEEVSGRDAQIVEGKIREETMNSAVEQVSQLIITVIAPDEASLKQALRDLINTYRAPRTVFGSLGSDARGKEILAEVCESGDGWQ